MKYELFVKVYFWIAALGVVAKLLNLTYLEYPRVVTHSRGDDALSLFINLAVSVIFGIWIWGSK